MPKTAVNNVEMYYEDSGKNDETIVFSHGLLWSCRMFDAQVADLKQDYRCVAFDHRGQGQTQVTQDGYDMDTLYEDAVALIESLDCAPVHFVGLSMGGFIGMRIAIRRPELLKSLILIETTADPEPLENIPRYKRLNMVARWLGFRLVTKPVMGIMFGQKFLNDPARADQRDYWKKQLWNNHKVGITRAVMGVIERDGVYDDIDKIKLPTLIMVGDQDVATVPTKSERMHAKIENSQMVIVPGAGHTSSVEEPAFINQQIREFLGTL
jgi:pimeloyl-ACP methyl ester carboxylesterase